MSAQATVVEIPVLLFAEGGLWALPPLLVGSVAAAAALTSLVRRDRRRHGSVFRHLARQFGLGRPERRVVVRVARRAGLGTPAAALLSRRCFEQAVRRAGEPESERLATIRRRVFE